MSLIAFNFSHIINELSFGPFYPSLHNPLDSTVATTPAHFHKFQYYLSVVPTIYTTSTSSSVISSLTSPSSSSHLTTHTTSYTSSSSTSGGDEDDYNDKGDGSSRRDKDRSNKDQQKKENKKKRRKDRKEKTKRRRQRLKNTIFTNQYAVTEKSQLVGERNIPGVFFKFDIEPVLLLIRHHRQPLLRLLVRLVNVLSGVLVAGSWSYQLVDWFLVACLPASWARRYRRAGAAAAGGGMGIGGIGDLGSMGREEEEGVGGGAGGGLAWKGNIS